MPTSHTAAKILDSEFLDIRAKLIDLAASLDRIQRAEGSDARDPRIDNITEAARMLTGRTPNRAEQIQILFSLP